MYNLLWECKMKTTVLQRYLTTLMPQPCFDDFFNVYFNFKCFVLILMGFYCFHSKLLCSNLLAWCFLNNLVSSKDVVLTSMIFIAIYMCKSSCSKKYKLKLLWYWNEICPSLVPRTIFFHFFADLSIKSWNWIYDQS